MAALAIAQLLLLAGTAFGLIGSALASAAAPAIVRATSSWAPAQRCRALTLLGLAPPLLTLAALISVLSPSLLAFAWPDLDHCLEHEGHAHLCFFHPPHVGARWAGLLPLAAVSASAGLFVAFLSKAVVATRLLGALSVAARFDAKHGAWVVPVARPFCVSVGLMRPRILVSEGLLTDATEDELEVMLAHEAAHVRRRDTLMRLLARAGSTLLWPQSRRSLLATLELSAEQACDEAAAHKTGDRLRVAETILAMERRLADATGASSFAVAFGSASVADRVEALLGPPRSGGAWARPGILVIAAIVVVFAASPTLHHATESTLAFLVH